MPQATNETPPSKIGHALHHDRRAKIAELLAPFLLAGMVILIALPWVGESLFGRQAVVWVANVLMLLVVWLGLRFRGQSWAHFGLTFQFTGWKALARTFGLSLLVFVIAVAAFILGSIIMGMIMGVPEQADMSGYNYLQGNLPMLILALIGVFIVSSFGEEVIYRAFLMNRIKELGKGSKQVTWIAVAISSVVFGLVHFHWGLMGVVQTFFMGLALAIAYLKTGRKLWINIIAHAYMDAILMIQMYLMP